MGGASVTLDNAGRATFVGDLATPMDLGAGTLDPDVNGRVVARFESDGTLAWAKGVGAPGESSTVSALDPEGALVVGVSDPAALVVKLDDNADELWRVSLSLPGTNQGPHQLATDTSGNSTVVSGAGGCYSPCPECLCCPVVCSGSALLSRLSANGQVLWSRDLGGRQAGGLALDAVGYAYVTVFVEAGSDSVTLLRKFDSRGDEVWSQVVKPTCRWSAPTFRVTSTS